MVAGVLVLDANGELVAAEIHSYEVAVESEFFNIVLNEEAIFLNVTPKFRFLCI